MDLAPKSSQCRNALAYFALPSLKNDSDEVVTFKGLSLWTAVEAQLVQQPPNDPTVKGSNLTILGARRTCWKNVAPTREGYRSGKAQYS